MFIFICLGPLYSSSVVIASLLLLNRGQRDLADLRGLGKPARRRFIEFFTATIRNRNTLVAPHARVAVKQFFDWCEERLELYGHRCADHSALIEQLGIRTAKPTAKHYLAAIRQLFCLPDHRRISRSGVASIW